MTDVTDWDDDYDPYLDDPDEQAAAEDRALDRHIEEQAAEEHWRHCDEVRGGDECDCPPYVPPRCRWWLRIPRPSQGGWVAGPRRAVTPHPAGPRGPQCVPTARCTPHRFRED